MAPRTLPLASRWSPTRDETRLLLLDYQLEALAWALVADEVAKMSVFLSSARDPDRILREVRRIIGKPSLLDLEAIARELVLVVLGR